MREIRCIVTAVIAGFLPHTLLAQARLDNYPSKPVTIVVAYPAGGAADADTRFWTGPLSISLGQPFVVDYKAGAGGNIGNAYVAKALPDGHTLLTIAGSITVPKPDLPFDLIKDFAQVSMLSKRSALLVVTPKLPVNSLREYVAYAKAHPEDINWGTAGVGSGWHLVGAWLSGLTGTKVTFLYYKGNTQNYTDLVAGRVHVSGMTLLSALPLIKSGKVRAIAQLGLDRSSYLPDLPTVAEMGFPGFEYTSWTGLLAPARTPAPVLSKLHQAIADYAKSPDALAKANKQGTELVASAPEDFRRTFLNEVARWQKVVQENNIKFEE